MACTRAGEVQTMFMPSLRTKYLSAVLGLVIPAMAITAWLDYRKAESVILDKTIASGRANVGAVVRSLDTLITLTQRQLAIFAGSPEAQRLLRESSATPAASAARQRLEERFRHAAASLLDLTSLILVNEKGRVVASSSAEGAAINRGDRAYFREAMQGRSVVEGPLTARSSGDTVYAIAEPVRVDGKVHGALVASLGLEFLNKTLIDPTERINGASLFVLSPAGHVIMHPQRTLVHADWGNTQLFHELRADSAGLVSYREADGTPMLAVGARLSTGWYVVIAASRESIYRNVHELRDRSLAVTLAAIALVGGLLFALINTLCRDLKRGVRFAESVAAGNLDQRLVLKRRDELGVLASALTGMVETLKKAITVSEKKTRELEAITEGIAGGVAKMVFDEGITILWGNPGFYSLSGRTREEYERDMRHSAFNIVHPDDFKALRASILRQAGQRDALTLTYRTIRKNGAIAWTYLKARYIEEWNGHPVFLGVFMDITPKIQAMQELEIEQQRYRALARLSDDILFEYDVATDALSYMGKCEAVFGAGAVSRGFLRSAGVRDVAHPDDVDALAVLFTRPEARVVSLPELRLKHLDGAFHWYHCALMHIFDIDGKSIRCVGKLSNIDRHKRKENELMLRSQIDGLTSCYNKTTAELLIRKALADAPDACHALLIIDIDNFKEANDTFGHAFGDSVLRRVAATLRAAFRNTDLCGRAGGDEFIIFAGDIRGRENVEERLAGLYARLDAVRVDGNDRYRLSASIGVALYPPHGKDYETLFKRADEAMYVAKRSGKGRFVLYGDEA